jgi:predicted phosphate transport protein (TIGR00153 family)
MFKSKKEKEAIEIYEKHSNIALECMDLFIKQVEALLDSQWEEIEKIEGVIYEKEREGDEFRRKSEYLFSEGLLFPSDRAIFINLSEQIDKVIDKIQQVSRIIALRRPSNDAVEFLKRSDILKYLEITKKSVETLNEAAMELLKGDLKGAVKKAHEVEKYESMADDMKLEILRKLYSEERMIEDVLSILQIEKIILWIDAISDKAEDASDVIILISAKTAL